MLKRMTALLCLALPLAAASAEEAAKVFPAEALRTLEIQAGAGDILVQAAGAPQVTVRVTKPDPVKCEIIMEQKGSTLRLEARNKTRSLLGSGCEAGFQVQAPKELVLDAAAGSGNIRVTQRNAALALRTGSGDIQLSGVVGDLQARLGSGGLKGEARSRRADVRCGSGSVDLTGLLGSADVKTGSGDVVLKWAEAPQAGAVDAKLGSGDISLFFPEKTRLQTHVLTGSGKVRNELGETASAEFKVFVKTGSGDVLIAGGAKPRK